MGCGGSDEKDEKHDPKPSEEKKHEGGKKKEHKEKPKKCKSNKLKVIGTTHASGVEGKFFNFKMKNCHIVEPGGEVHTKVRNDRDGKEWDVVIWGKDNGGEGDAHGRIDPAVEDNNFQKGDKLYFVDRKTNYIKVVGTKHESGAVGKFFNFNRRHTNVVEDGKEEKIDIKNKRTDQKHHVVIWGSSNGGEGDSHGRIDPHDEGDNFKKGDKLKINEESSCDSSHTSDSD